MNIDADTKDWIRTAADDRAAAAGMRFDGERGVFVCDWIENYCCLYEGDTAGQPLRLMPYQRDFTMRLFSWVWWSDEWGQYIRRFREASLWAAKKNGKSPYLAAVGLYLLCADGEAGQKVYSMAKNGDQAKIAQRHAFNMVLQSPALKDDCKVHRSTLQIAHLPTNSMMIVLTGDDIRGAQAKEGLNGSAIIDEVHVVDRQMIESTCRMGISRKEPLQLSGSTSGDDPSSYGFERFQYGRQVNKGDRDDPHFLHEEFCAPDNVSDADIDDHLDEYGKAANPAWGFTVKPTEFRNDWRSSKGNPRKVAKFRQHRLNLWVGSTNPWLDTAGWDAGRREYALEDLAGRDCFLGLDLSRRSDMTSAVFLFPWFEDGPECVRMWPMFWLPAETARDRDHLFPFRSWAADGHLTLTAGATVDYSAVKADIRAAVNAHRLNVLNLFYDQTYANEMTQALHEGEQLGGAVEPGVVAERTVVRQGIMSITGLACEFERRVKAGLVQHPGNAVMTWQVGHCEVVRDRNQNIAPAKPSPHSGKSIDGVAAAIDAMAGVVDLRPAESNVYDERGPLIL